MRSMKVISSPGQVNPPGRKPRVLVIGVFDGLHVGHQKLIQQAWTRARELRGELWVMTFAPHPVHVLHPEVKLPLIISLQHRLFLLKTLNVDVTCVIPFTRVFARQTPRSFIRRYLAGRIQPREIFVGDDFRFGQNRSGSLAVFSDEGKKHGFVVHAVESIPGQVGKISSTQIRHWIAEGYLRKAQKFLGRPVAVMGAVVRGDARGHLLGFPTANLRVIDELLPPRGVYAVEVEIHGRRYPGMTNIGQRPSFTPLDENIFIETHIFDFDRNLYGKTLIIHFHKKIRNERRFSSPEKLVVQLKQDRVKAQSILK